MAELTDSLTAAARLGAMTTDWLHTPLGRYVQERANDEVDAATADLVDAAPEDLQAQIQIRRRIQRAQDAITWLLDAIDNGQRAVTLLDRYED
jgi:hypothetical protein